MRRTSCKYCGKQIAANQHSAQSIHGSMHVRRLRRMMNLWQKRTGSELLSVHPELLAVAKKLSHPLPRFKLIA